MAKRVGIAVMNIYYSYYRILPIQILPVTLVCTQAFALGLNNASLVS